MIYNAPQQQYARGCRRSLPPPLCYNNPQKNRPRRQPSPHPPEAPLTVLQIIANRPGAGKTLLAGALLARLANAGQTAGSTAAWYKPLSPTPAADPDAAFMRQLLPLAAVPPPLPQPYNPADNAALTQEQQDEIAAAVSNLAATFDPVLVEWALPLADSAPPPILPDHPILLLHGYTAGQPANRQAAAIAAAAQNLGSDLSGILINGVLRYRRRETDREIIAPLRDQGLPVLGAIPESRPLLALTLQQIADGLGGRWIQEPADFSEAIDRFLIGGNLMDSGPHYFGRYPRQGVLTRGGRPDLQLACLATGTNTRLLALTEGVEPTEYIRVTARHQNTPILLLDGPTLETAAALAAMQTQAHPYTPEKLAHFAALMDKHLDTWPNALQW